MFKLRRHYQDLKRKADVRFKFFDSLPTDAVVLDLGCGGGAVSRSVKEVKPLCTIHGVDSYQPESFAADINFQKADLETDSLPFSESFFDAVVFTHVIEHLRSPLKVAEEIRRVLKPGGLIYVETPNWTTMLVPSFGFNREAHNPFNFFDDHTHIKPWTKHGLFEWLYQENTGCDCEVLGVGTTRNIYGIPRNIESIIKGVIRRDRGSIIPAFWNLYGWCIYAVGRRRPTKEK